MEGCARSQKKNLANTDKLSSQTHLRTGEVAREPLHAAVDQPLSVAYVCDGPRVPEDLHEATIETLVEAALRTP